MSNEQLLAGFQLLNAGTCTLLEDVGLNESDVHALVDRMIEMRWEKRHPLSLPPDYQI